MLFIAAALVLGAAAQPTSKFYPIGTPVDICTGGNPLQVPTSPSSTVRWGNFTCTVPVDGDGLYAVKLDFLEPCFAAGACAGGQVAAPGQRVENVYANDAPILVGLDTFAAGATDVNPATRQALVYSSASKIILRFVTVTRSAVVSMVTVRRATEATTAPPYAVAMLQGLEAQRPVDCPNALSFFSATDTGNLFWCYENLWHPLVGAIWQIK